MATNAVYLGTAITHPVQVSNGKPVIVGGLAVVEQSIASILSTPIGSRFMLPEYGSRLEELVFEQNDEVLQGLLRTFIFEALQKWEKRVKFTDVTFVVSDDMVECTISYQILPSNEIKSFVFPFYREIIY